MIDKVLDKYGIIDGSHDDFCLLQQLSDGGKFTGGKQI